MPERLSIKKATNLRIKGIEESPVAYANLCQVAFTAEEAFLLFALRSTENVEEGTSIIKIVTNLPHAKRIWRALGRQIDAYESTFGEINADATDTLTPEARQAFGIDKDDNNGNGSPAE